MLGKWRPEVPQETGNGSLTRTPDSAWLFAKLGFWEPPLHDPRNEAQLFKIIYEILLRRNHRYFTLLTNFAIFSFNRYNLHRYETRVKISCINTWYSFITVGLNNCGFLSSRNNYLKFFIFFFFTILTILINYLLTTVYTNISLTSMHIIS